MILAINGGSSSLKFALFGDGDLTAGLVLGGQLRGIGSKEGAKLELHDGGEPRTEPVDAPDLDAATRLVLERSTTHGALRAAVHRLVHGGTRLAAPTLIDDRTRPILQELVPLAPNHLAGELTCIDTVRAQDQDLPQIACFDTWFHRTLPPAARLLGLPRGLADQGVVRYGFHGLSYEFVAQRYGALGRVVAAHLGSGASLCAMQDGTSVDTTMGFTPTGGIVMGTRSGDLDPGALLYMMQHLGYDAAAVGDAVEKQGGLLGVSGVSADLRALRDSDHPQARDAVSMFCLQVRKCIGAYAAALGGIDALVFTGGIGEHMPDIRARICDGLAFLGIVLDATANEANQDQISHGTVAVHVLTANEELMLALHATAFLQEHPI